MVIRIRSELSKLNSYKSIVKTVDFLLFLFSLLKKYIIIDIEKDDNMYLFLMFVLGMVIAGAFGMLAITLFSNYLAKENEEDRIIKRRKKK